MATRLKNIRLDRVDLVDNGACLDKSTGAGAHVRLFKRDDNAKIDAFIAKAKALSVRAGALAASIGDDVVAKDWPLRTFDQQMAVNAEHRKMRELEDAWWTFTSVCHDIIARVGGTAKTALLQESAVQFGGMLLALLTEFDSAITAEAVAKETGETAEAIVEKRGAKISEARLKTLKAMETSLAAILAECEPGSGESTMNADEKKTADEAVQKRIDDAVKTAVDAAVTKATTDANARIEKAEGIAKAEREARLTREFTDVVKGLAGVPDLKDEDVAVFKSVAEKAAEEWPRVLDLLQKSAAAVKAVVLQKAAGSGSQVTKSADTAEGRVMAKAAEIAAADKTTVPVALAKMASDPAHAELMREYNDEVSPR